MLDLLRLLFDAGLFVLIWTVQLVVYPSFRYYAERDLLIWHKKYSSRITVLVMPLMLGQIITAGLQMFYLPSFHGFITIFLIGMIWANTFFQAIPLHVRIDQKKDTLQAVRRLIQVNWIRTVLWSVVFIANFTVGVIF